MKNIFAIIAMCSLIVFSGCGTRKVSSKYSVNLNVWGVFDNSSVYTTIFSEYAKINENIAPVSYQKHTLDAYKNDLLGALAAGNGPDIFMIHNSWMPDFQDKIVPMPKYMGTEAEFRANFVDVVADDVISDGQMYGVPLFVDSLGLYYNKDIFNAAGITHPPKTWDEFDAAVKKLTQFNDSGNIEQSAAAIGTAFNVNRSSDLLAALMIQNGAEMSQKNADAITFDSPVQGVAGVPGEDALKYYTRFASAGSPLYTWNKKQNYSIDEFFQGQTAMMINYAYHYDTIKAKNAKLHFAVADLPQVSLDTTGTQANYANYWVFVVAKNKQPTQSSSGIPVTNDMRVHEAWQLLKAISFPTTNGVTITNALNGESLIYKTEFDLTQMYLEMTGKPAARRDLIDAQIADVRLGAFARGNLIAKTWWRHDAEAIETLFADMIDNVNTGRMSVHDALELGTRRAQQLQ